MPICIACKKDVPNVTVYRGLCSRCDTLRRMIHKRPAVAKEMVRKYYAELNKQQGIEGHAKTKTTGRFKTRKDLEDRILYLWTTTDMSLTDIGKDCLCGRVTVWRILNKHEKEESKRYRRKDYDWRY